MRRPMAAPATLCRRRSHSTCQPSEAFRREGMKLLHTSDLHLGAQWRSVSRADDQTRVLDEVLTLCDQHEVDALLVTGDVFSDRPYEPPARIARRLLERLSDQLRRGRAIVLLRGNHDPLDLFQLMRI